MATTTISSRRKVATGINVFVLPPERQTALLDTLNAINQAILTHKFPMNVSSNFHRGLDASVIVNYNQYTDRESGQYLRTRAETAPLLKRTHDLSERHELRWYEVADVVTNADDGDAIEISDAAGRVAAIGVFTVAPEKQGDLLALLRDHGQALKREGAPGFLGLASHRGNQGAHAATYEQWSSADAYRQAMRQPPAAERLAQIRAMAAASELQVYEVLTVTRFDLN